MVDKKPDILHLSKKISRAKGHSLENNGGEHVDMVLETRVLANDVGDNRPGW